MSHPPYMPWWIGDYLRDTQHLSTEQHGAYMLLIAHCWQHQALPRDPVGRAQIVRLPLQRWNKIKAPVEEFFREDGTHGRVTKERARAEHLNAVRSVAGSKGGLRSAATRAKHTASKTRDPPQANSQATAQPNVTAIQRQNRSSAQAYQTKNQNLTSSSEYEAASAREAVPQEVVETQDKSAGSLATALDGSALTRPPAAESAATQVKPPSEVTRAELEATFERRRASEAAAAAERTRRVWGRSQPPPPAASTEVKKEDAGQP